MKKITIRSRYLALLLSSLALLTLLSCRATQPSSPDGSTTPKEPLLPMEATVPTPPTLTEDTTDHTALAMAAFADAPIAPAQDFDYTLLEDGSACLTAYHGTAEVLILPDTVDGTVVRALCDELFKDQTALRALFIPDSVTQVGKNLLRGCRALCVLRTPTLFSADGQNDGYLAYFFGAASTDYGYLVPASLETVILGDAATVIGQSAFRKCAHVRTVLLPQTLTEIEAYAFVDCEQLYYVALPEGLTTIGDQAFANCTSLLSFELSDSLQLGEGVLMGCSSLQTLTLPRFDGAITHLGRVFGAASYTWNEGYVPKSLVRVTVQHGDIPDYAFYGCASLAEVIPAPDCRRIGVRAFWGCTALQELCLPDGVEHVGDLALAHCRTLYRVALGKSLTHLGIQVFYDCTNLYEIALPDTLATLPASTFADCRCLTHITGGRALQSVGDQAFRHCGSLQSVADFPTELAIGDGNDALLTILRPNQQQE